MKSASSYQQNSPYEKNSSSNSLLQSNMLVTQPYAKVESILINPSSLSNDDIAAELNNENDMSSSSSSSSSSLTSNNKKNVSKRRSQVKNACVNCQKACKKCDEGRPCQRCIKLGITDTCQDSPRKERKKGFKRGPYRKKSVTTQHHIIPKRDLSETASSPLFSTTINNTTTVTVKRKQKLKVNTKSLTPAATKNDTANTTSANWSSSLSSPSYQYESPTYIDSRHNSIVKMENDYPEYPADISQFNAFVDNSNRTIHPNENHAVNAVTAHNNHGNYSLYNNSIATTIPAPTIRGNYSYNNSNHTVMSVPYHQQYRSNIDNGYQYIQPPASNPNINYNSSSNYYNNSLSSSPPELDAFLPVNNNWAYTGHPEHQMFYSQYTTPAPFMPKLEDNGVTSMNKQNHHHYIGSNNNKYYDSVKTNPNIFNDQWVTANSPVVSASDMYYYPMKANMVHQ